MVSAILLRLPVKTFDRGRPLVFGVDETIKRRRGEKIAANYIRQDQRSLYALRPV